MNINSVVGGGIKNPEDARTINNRARDLGFSTSIGIIHDGSGHLKPLGGAERKVYDEVSAAINGPWQVVKNLYSGIRGFQDNLADGKPNEWRCRAGARYLYVCEEGLVHYCSQQRGYPGVPLESYSIDDIKREFGTPRPARRTARSAVCTACRRWISGGARRKWSSVVSRQSSVVSLGR